MIRKGVKMDVTDTEIDQQRTGSNETNAPKKIRLSGAARKRFKTLLLNNVDKDEAVNLCKFSYRMIMEKVPGLILHKNDSGNLETSPNENNSSPTSSELDNFQVGIRNRKPMTEQELNLVRQSLLANIIEFSKGKGPRFNDCVHKAGCLLITCEDEKSKLWLEHQVPTLNPWLGAELSLMYRAKSPKRTIGEVTIPSLETDEPSVAIALMRSQNNGLNTELWEVDSKVDERGLTLTVILDDDSAQAIRRTDCRVYIGFSKVVFKLSCSGGPYNLPRMAQGESTSEQRPTTSRLNVSNDDPTVSSCGERSTASQMGATPSVMHRPGLSGRGVFKAYKISSEFRARARESCEDRQGFVKPQRDSSLM